MKIISTTGELLDKKVLSDNDIISYLCTITMLVLICRLSGTAQFIMSIYASFKALFNLRIQFFNKLGKLNKTFYDLRKTGWLVSRCTGDLGTLMDFMCFTIMIIAICLTYFAITGMQVMSISFELIIPLCFILPLPFYLISIFKRRMKIVQRRIKRSNSHLISFLAENIKGLKVVQAFSKESSNSQSFNTLSLEQFKKSIQAVKLNAIFIPIIDFIGILGIVVVMLIGLYLINTQENEQIVRAGELATVILFLYIVLNTIRMLMEVLSMTISALASAERVYEVMDNKAEMLIKENAIHPTKLKGSIDFTNVNFSYKLKGPLLFENLNFSILPGETIALVGHTGSGKTTIASLLMRFYDIHSGSIKIDDIDIKDYHPDSLHQCMGMVLQDGFLFSGTILENLRFSNESYSREDIIEIAEKLGTHNFIEKLPLGYDTIVHEGGSSLSMGQRQIVTMTRALIANPDILILDEATSSIDLQTEAIITKSMNRLISNRTSIIIAHRLSTIRNADKILLIDHGKIVESGNHDTLIEKNGLYAKLHGN